MFLSAAEMKEAEEALFAQGVSAESLMDLAGEGIAREIQRRWPWLKNPMAIAVSGPGNNGADAMVALKHLRASGWKTAIRLSQKPSDLKNLPAKKFTQLGEIDLLHNLESINHDGDLILLDGLLGIGSRGEIREPLASLAKEINRLKHRAEIVSVDLPSGLHCNDGKAGKNTVEANLTCSLGTPKSGLIADSATKFTGAIADLPLPGLSFKDEKADHFISPGTLKPSIKKLHRSFDFHKGQAGRVGLIAGSRGLAGAASLTTIGALRGGAGLITLFVLEEDYETILPLIPVEAMVKPVSNFRDILNENLDVLAVGPGLGNCGSEILSVIQNFRKPSVVDADALNLIARSGEVSMLRENQIVTPHPGEMARLLPDLSGKETRSEVARKFVSRCPATLLFKGARSIVTSAGFPLAYNTTGTPAMAGGGQGDVLTGLLAALLAQGLNTLEAAMLGAWLSGRAAELALGSESTESLSATTTASFLGRAFSDLRNQA